MVLILKNKVRPKRRLASKVRVGAHMLTRTGAARPAKGACCERVRVEL